MSVSSSATRSVVIGAVLVLLAGCGGTASDEPRASTSTTKGPTVVTINGPVKAGTYRFEIAEPPFEITLDGDDWYAGRPSPSFNGFNLFPSDPDGYLTVFRPEEVFEGGKTVPVPDDLVAWLRNHPTLSVGPSSTVDIDGHPATRFDARVTKANETCDMGDGVDVACALLAPVPSNEPYRLSTAERIRFWVLDADGPLLIGVSHRAESFDAFVERAELAVQSVHFLGSS